MSLLDLVKHAARRQPYSAIGQPYSATISKQLSVSRIAQPLAVVVDRGAVYDKKKSLGSVFRREI